MLLGSVVSVAAGWCGNGHLSFCGTPGPRPGRDRAEQKLLFVALGFAFLSFLEFLYVNRE
jgi:hypothetical protein